MWQSFSIVLNSTSILNKTDSTLTVSARVLRAILLPPRASQYDVLAEGWQIGARSTLTVGSGLYRRSRITKSNATALSLSKGAVKLRLNDGEGCTGSSRS